MKWGVLVFPGSNDDQDALWALGDVLGQEVVALWHKEADLKGVDGVVSAGRFLVRRLPPLRSDGALLADHGERRTALPRAVASCSGSATASRFSARPGCFPARWCRNRSLTFVCQRVRVRVENAASAFTIPCRQGEVLEIPIKHGEGCYVADEATLGAARSGRSDGAALHRRRGTRDAGGQPQRVASARSPAS